MSGFEIAGIVLGGLPIVFKAAENYKQGLEPLIKWRRYQSNFRNFVSDVDIERQMFDGLCTRLLGYTDLSQEQKNLLLTGQDSTGWCSSETEIALKKRLGASYDSCQYLLNLMGEDLLKLQEILSLKDGSVDWIKPGEKQWEYQRKRLAHSFSSKGPDAIASLNKNNRRFRDLLDNLDEKIAAGHKEQLAVLSPDSGWARIFECIRKQASSLHAALQNGWKCTCNVPHMTSLRLQQRTAKTSQFILTFANPTRKTKHFDFNRKFVVSIKGEKPDQAVMIVSSVQPAIQENYITKLRSNIELRNPGSNELRFYNEAELCLRSTSKDSASNKSSFKRPWKSSLFGSGSGSASCSPTTSSTITIKPKKSVRLDVPVIQHSHSTPNLSGPALLPQTGAPAVAHTPVDASIDVPDDPIEITNLCAALGTCEDNCTYLGYLTCPQNRKHEFRSLKDTSRSGPDSTSDLISLEAILTRSQKLRLTRKQRFRLTVILASSLLQLQTTPWTTGKLSKKDIFFEHTASEVFSEHPYIHHSFHSCSAKKEENIAKDEPLARNNRGLTRASMTSLGILLLELLFASPIESQEEYRSQYLVNGEPHNETNYLTALLWIDDIEAEAGLGYRDAVKACFDFDVKPDWENGTFVSNVYEKVVKRLEGVLEDAGWSGKSVAIT